VRLDDCKTVSR